MPRASTATKRQQGAANQRDTRHENGLVGPGKPVRKQKSHGHLNGHAKSNEHLPTTPPLPEPPATNGHARHPASGDTTMESRMPLEALRRTSLGGCSESSSSEPYNHPPLMPVAQDNHRRIDVNAAKNPAVHRDAGHFHLAVTVLRSMPLADTIAILIILLQLPPTILSIIHMLFITLTFVPASSNGELSLGGLFEGTVATPSIATIIVVDIIFGLLWIFLWTPIRGFSLEFAQSVIALTLGGATSGREAGMSNVFVCFGIVGVNHFAHKNAKRSSLGAGLSSLTKGYLGSTDPDDPLESVSTSANEGSSQIGGLQKLLAIHIIAQGAVRYIRDWYVRREKRVTATSVGDPEAAKGLADIGNDTQNSQTPDNESSTSLPVTSLASNPKKRKKQSQQLRTRQPVWSALASTKIVMVKEYETSSAAAESAGTNATDINNLGNAPFHKEADRIWITHIGHDSVVFGTSYFPTYTAPQNPDEKCSDSAAIDPSKPFYVRVNSSVWQPTRIYTDTTGDETLLGHTSWEGEIPGLTPMSNYKFDFISTSDASVIFSTSVMTLAPKLDVSAGPAPKPVVGGRPGSPKETLKNSIAAGEKRLAEDKSKQKRERKDHRAKLNSIRKDIDKLNSSMASSGGSDDKLRQKVQQSKTHMKQAEDDLEAITAEIQTLSTTPIVDPSQYKSLKYAYKSEKEEHKKLESDIKATKQSNESDLQTLQAEVTTLQQKKDRMQNRIAKLNGELERIMDANERGLNEAQRIANEREAKITEQAKMEYRLQVRLDEINADIEALAPNVTALAQQVQYLYHAEYMATLAATSGSPATSAANLTYGAIPEGNIAVGTSNYPWNPVPATSGLYAPPPYGSGMMHAPTPASQSPYRRGRSSSMLSNVSGFTQSSFEGPSSGYPHYTGDEVERKGSSGNASLSGSGSGSGTGSAGSVGDPKSPIGNGNGKAVPNRGSGIWDDR